MVKVVDFKTVENEHEKKFNLLILEGGIESVISATGNLYLTSRRAGVACTFNEQKCQELIGENFPGSIRKVPCEPYEYSIPDSSETVILHHKYEYQNVPRTTEDHVFSEDEELIAE